MWLFIFSNLGSGFIKNSDEAFEALYTCVPSHNTIYLLLATTPQFQVL